MAITVQAFINSALRLIQVLDPGESPSTTESNNALETLNQVIGGWSFAGITIYKIAKDTLACSGVPSYTIGTGGSIPTARPLKIRAAAVLSGNAASQLEPYTAEQWASIKDKSVSSKFAKVFFYDGGYPQATIYLWPAPKSGSTLELYSIKPLTQFLSLVETIDLPPGYEHTLRCSLAQALAPEYGSVVSPEVQAMAAEAKQSLAKLNAEVLGMSIPVGVPSAPAAAQAAAAQVPRPG